MALTQISTAGVKDDAVTSGKIPANAVGSSELADNAVDTDAIANLAVTEAKLGATSVTASKIAQNAVSLDKLPLGNNTVDGKFLRANNGSAPTFETVNTTPADGSITSAKLADGSVQGDKIANAGIGANKLAANSVTNTNIIDGNVTASELATNAVTTVKIQDGAVNSAKIADGAIVNADVNTSAAINGTKIAPNFGSQNIETTGSITCDGEFQPHWIGHQSQCADNTYNTNVYWKVAEVTGGGSEGGKIEFFGTTDYSGLGINGQAARTTLVLRHLTNNQLAGIWWTESGGYTAITDIRWKYNGANNVYTIWVKSGAYSNVVPHITGSFDYAQTYGSSTGSSGAPSGSTAFENKFAIEMKDNAEPAININSEALITYPTRPCFHGGIMANYSSGIVEFDRVHVNRGSHYATSNDRFVCPVDGIYFVAFFGMSHNSVSTMDIAVRKNGSDYQGVVPYSGSHTGAYHHVSGQGLIDCSKNDYLQVHIGSGSFYGTSSGRHSGFTVFLVG